MEFEKRLDYIDTIKGLGIILVMLGHSISATANPLNMFILSFHMPLFFFAGGMLMCYGSGEKNYSYSFFKYVKHKLLSIVRPFLLL